MSGTNTRSLVDSLGIPHGSSADILATYDIPHMSSMVLEGAINWQEVYKDVPTLGYLWEIWQATAGGEQGTDIDDSGSFASLNNFVVSKTDLKQLLLNFTAKSKAGNSVGTLRPTGDYGYVQFLYAGGSEAVRHISFQHNKLSPRYKNCTGANLWFTEPRSGTYVTYFNGSGMPRFLGGGGQPFSPLNNQTAGVGWGAELTAANTQTYDVGATSMPLVNTGVINSHSYTSEAWIDIGTHFGGGPWATIQAAYLADIWQDVACPQVGTAGNAYDVTDGDQVISASLNFAKSMQLSVIVPPGTRKDLDWRAGLPIYGAWAPVYGSLTGELEWINHTTSVMVPKSRNCNGVWIYLKHGCSGLLTMQEANEWTEGISNPTGPVNFYKGTMDGMTWDV